MYVSFIAVSDEMADLRTQIKQTQDYLGHYMKGMYQACNNSSL